MKLHNAGSSHVSEDLLALAYGPDARLTRYPGCIVNGIKFLTMERDARRKTQNCGVRVEGEHDNKWTEFFGVLTEIIELTYAGYKQVFLFKCDWFDNRRFKSDKFFTSVNIKKKWYLNEPYVLAIQCSQVFYVQDTEKGSDKMVVQKVDPRHIWDEALFETPQVDSNTEPTNEEMEVYQQNECSNTVIDVDELDFLHLNREDEVPDIVQLQRRTEWGHNHNVDDDFINDIEEEIATYGSAREDNEDGFSSDSYSNSSE